ncbi:17S U2 SnRNP complex component HTATSF1 [Parasteatoda tepidariorum]|uniref:17S U2 SnRNP complex component HTATSF1 n=1 Tax=Parasteatoda tepidariorum TaxID=114398 RepID=UPI001C727BE9|nr:uncharacterized protein LOC122268363 [Parasteatoda tepidariorum]
MMHKIVICWIFIADFFACSYSYVKMMYINTDNGYCEYLNGLLIPVNDYAFDVEKCEIVNCEPGKIRITGCAPVFFRPKHPSISCTLVRGKGIFECCPTFPKCKVIGPLPENYSFPKHWIMEDYGNFTQVPSNEDTSEKNEHKEDLAEKNDYEEDSAEEDTFKNDYEGDSAEEDTFEYDGEEDSVEEDKKFENDDEEDSEEEDEKFENDYEEVSGEPDKFEKSAPEKYRAEKYDFAEYTTEEVTTQDDATEKTQDPLLSEINRYARNYPIS